MLEKKYIDNYFYLDSSNKSSTNEKPVETEIN